MSGEGDLLTQDDLGINFVLSEETLDDYVDDPKLGITDEPIQSPVVAHVPYSPDSEQQNKRKRTIEDESDDEGASKKNKKHKKSKKEKKSKHSKKQKKSKNKNDNLSQESLDEDQGSQSSQTDSSQSQTSSGKKKKSIPESYQRADNARSIDDMDDDLQMTPDLGRSVVTNDALLEGMQGSSDGIACQILPSNALIDNMRTQFNIDGMDQDEDTTEIRNSDDESIQLDDGSQRSVANFTTDDDFKDPPPAISDEFLRLFEERRNTLIQYYNFRLKVAKTALSRMHIANPADGKPVIDAKEALVLLEAFESLWNVRSNDVFFEEEKLILTRVNIGIPGSGHVGPEQVETAIYKEAYYPLAVLTKKLMQCNLLDEENENAKKIEARIHRLQDLLFSLYWGLYHSIRSDYRLKNSVGTLGTGTTHFLLWMPRPLIEQTYPLTAEQKFLLYVMDKLSMHDYRIFGQDVYEAIWTEVDDDHPVMYYTNAWSRKCSLLEYVNGCCDANVEFAQFVDMTHNSTFSTASRTARFLSEYTACGAVPRLKVTRYLFSFLNGIYNVKEDIFVPYRQMASGLDSLANDPDPPGIKVANIFGYTADCASVNYFPMDFDDYNQKRKTLDVTLMETSSQVAEVNNNTESMCDDADTYLTDLDDFAGRRAQQSPGGTYYVVNDENGNEVAPEDKNKFWGMDIHTPNLDRILLPHLEHITEENERKEIMRQYWWLLGRTLFWAGHGDKNDICLYTIGPGGTAKSTLYDFVMNLYPKEFIAVLSSNCERQWVAGSIIGPNIFSIWAPEIGANFKFSQEEFCSLVSHEEMLVASKFKDPRKVKCAAQLSCAGNVFAGDAFSNEGDKIKRRCAIMRFRKVIPAHLMDPHLKDKLKEELPNILQKLVKCFREISKEHGHEVFWKWCHPEFKKMSDEIVTDSDPLLKFLDQQIGQVNYTSNHRDPVLFTPVRYVTTMSHGIPIKKTEPGNGPPVEVFVKPFVTLEDLKREFYKWAKTQSIKVSGDMWSTHKIDPIFQQKGIVILKTEEDWEKQQVPENMRPALRQNMQWLYGVEIVGNDTHHSGN